MESNDSYTIWSEYCLKFNGGLICVAKFIMLHKKDVKVLQFKPTTSTGERPDAYLQYKTKVMAIIKNNDLIEGISGKYGAHVFKQVRGKSVVCPHSVRLSKESVVQKENRIRFREASQWAKSILQESDHKAYYQMKARKLKLPNAYTAAIAEYMRGGEVLAVNLSESGMTKTVQKKKVDWVSEVMRLPEDKRNTLYQAIEALICEFRTKAD